MKPHRRLHHVAVAFALGVAIVGCTDVPTAAPEVNTPSLKKGGGGGGGGGGDGGAPSFTVAMSGDLAGAGQQVSGKNDATSLTLTGDYELTLDVLTGLECVDLPGRIPDEPGLLAFVQSNTPRVGSLDLQYDKTSADQTHVDRWTTTIGDHDFRVQIFRWGTTSIDEGSDGTTVSYRGGSIEVFKMKRGKYVSREQCFGPYVDYDLTVQ